MLSPHFILTSNPHSISKAKPKDEIVKSGLYFNPINKPAAPKNSKSITKKANCSNSNRLKSLCKLSEIKYIATYIKNDILENNVHTIVTIIMY